jgi:hypothetical protein
MEDKMQLVGKMWGFVNKPGGTYIDFEHLQYEHNANKLL